MTDDEVLAINGGRPTRTSPYPWPVHGVEEERLLLDVLHSGRWSFDGPKEAELARAWCDYLRVPYGLLVSSGTVALEIAVEALSIQPGDEIIVPALTWTAPARAIVKAGATAIFVDISPDDWCLDLDEVERALTPRTRAIIVVHTYAHMADMDRIGALAAAHNLAVIEDCAHAHGSAWKGRPAGTIGDIGCFSFQQSKTQTAGEGGLVVTSDVLLADRLYGLKNCGRRRTLDSQWGFGGNYRMTEFQAAILLAQLSRLDDQLDAKLDNVASFEERVSLIAGITPLRCRPEVSRRNLFGLSLRVDIDHFAGVPTPRLTAALAAEGLPVFLPHGVIYRSPMWVSGVSQPRWNGRGQERLGLLSRCPRAEEISARGGLVVAHEAFLGPRANVDDLVTGFERVSRLADTVPRDAQDTRRI